MRALLTFGGLLVVLAIIALTARHQLDTNRRFLPGAASAASGASSEPFGGATQVTPAQYQQELNKVLREGAQQGADRAASAGDDSK